MINKILKTLIFVMFCTLIAFNPVFASKQEETWEEIYEKLEPANFEYIFGIDPFQAEEYTKYTFSPYPLFRIGVPFVFKETVIDPGYYLLTPRKKGGRTYMLFKENGRVKHLIPVYEVDMVEPLFYEQYAPERKKGFWEKAGEKTSNFFGRLFPERTQRMPAPKSYIEVNDVNGEFWQVILYYGSQKYYMLFRQK